MANVCFANQKRSFSGKIMQTTEEFYMNSNRTLVRINSDRKNRQHYPYWWRANSNVPDNCRKYFGRIHITKSQSSCATPSTNNIQNHKCPIIFSAKCIKNSFVLDILAKILWVICKNYLGKYVSNLVTKYVNMYVLWN